MAGGAAVARSAPANADANAAAASPVKIGLRSMARPPSVEPSTISDGLTEEQTAEVVVCLAVSPRGRAADDSAPRGIGIKAHTRYARVDLPVEP
jgi:hypothetical protein